MQHAFWYISLSSLYHCNVKSSTTSLLIITDACLNFILVVEQKLNTGKCYEFHFGGGELRNISIVLFLATNQHSGPDTELKVGQFPAMFLGQLLIDL